MNFTTLLIASHNKGKVREIGELLAPLGLHVKSAAELNIVEPEETGNTFVANAQLKAHHCAKASNLPALSDDSGLVIPALGGDPGIFSARWAGESKDFSLAFARIQSELKDVDALPPVAAYFVCVLCLAFPDGRAFDFEGRIEGTLTFPPRGLKGFGYDPIFIPDGYDVTFAELEPNIKSSISHRAKAFALFLEFLHSNR